MLEQGLIWYARNFPIRQGKLRLVNALWRLAAGQRGPHRMARLIYGGYTAPCDLREMLQRQFYFFGTYQLEARLLDRWRVLARNSDVVFDVGANAGIYSLAALAANPQAVVHAFEPTPKIAERLRATARMNQLNGLMVHQVAISDFDGTARLMVCDGGEDNDGMNYIVADQTDSSEQKTVVRRIETFSDDINIEYIDLMKIDVQGLEPNVLRGAERVLMRGAIGTIFVELNWGSEGQSCSASQTIDMLERAGYRFTAPGLADQLRPAGPWMRNLNDVVASRP